MAAAAAPAPLRKQGPAARRPQARGPARSGDGRRGQPDLAPALPGGGVCGGSRNPSGYQPPAGRAPTALTRRAARGAERGGVAGRRCGRGGGRGRQPGQGRSGDNSAASCVDCEVGTPAGQSALAGGGPRGNAGAIGAGRAGGGRREGPDGHTRRGSRHDRDRGHRGGPEVAADPGRGGLPGGAGRRLVAASVDRRHVPGLPRSSSTTASGACSVSRRDTTCGRRRRSARGRTP